MVGWLPGHPGVKVKGQMSPHGDGKRDILLRQDIFSHPTLLRSVFSILSLNVGVLSDICVQCLSLQRKCYSTDYYSN